MSETFVYVTYIRTTPEKLWEALTKPEFNKVYWFGAHQECSFEKDAPWKLVFDDGHDSGLYSWKYLRELGEKQEENWRRYQARVQSAQ